LEEAEGSLSSGMLALICGMIWACVESPASLRAEIKHLATTAHPARRSSSRRIDVQSLKSTAFAVTLLAISFGLYCVSSTSPKPETEFVDPIQIDSQFATTRDYYASSTAADFY